MSAGLTLAAGILLGLLGYDSWMRWRGKLHIPNQWLLAPRGLVTNDEYEVWEWLKRAFHDHEVLVKTPIARYSRARDPKQSKKWFRVLEGVYCTFSICTPDGTVVGCLDVPGKHGLLRSHRDMKESILSTCGIAYAVVRASNLPTLDAIRAAFIDEFMLADEEPRYAVQDDFEREVSSFAENSRTKPAPLEDGRGPARRPAPRFDPLRTRTGIVNDSGGSGWEDSFMNSSESRPAAL